MRASENAVPELPRVVSVTLLSKVAGEFWLGDPVERPKGRRVALALGELGRPLGLDDRHALLERALVRLGRLGRSSEARGPSQLGRLAGEIRRAARCASPGEEQGDEEASVKTSDKRGDTRGTHPETRGAGFRPFLLPPMNPPMNEFEIEPDRPSSTLALDFLWLIEPFLGKVEPEAGLGGTLLLTFESYEPTSVREKVAGFLDAGETELPRVGEARLMDCEREKSRRE